MAELDTEVKVPVALIVAALLIFVAYGALSDIGIGPMMIMVGINAVVGVPLAIIACMIAASVMGMSFGYFWTACLKLAAIFTFPVAVQLLVPIPLVGWVIGLVLYFGLLSWLFDLEPWETVVIAIVIWAVRVGVSFILAMLLLAA